MLIMDRENPFARGWSHVLSTTDDLTELDAFRRRIGAPVSALQRRKRIPHLDICRRPRERALALAGQEVRVFASAMAMMREYRLHRRARTLTCPACQGPPVLPVRDAGWIWCGAHHGAGPLGDVP